MLVTIEGVVHTDVCSRGERTTVEYTGFVRSLVGQGLVRIVDWPVPARPVRVAVPEDTVRTAVPKRRTRGKNAAGGDAEAVVGDAALASQSAQAALAQSRRTAVETIEDINAQLGEDARDAS